MQEFEYLYTMSLNTMSLNTMSINTMSINTKSKYGLSPIYDINNKWEIGVDEAGRGPMFGRLYVAAVILPKGDQSEWAEVRDSKKIHSHSKIRNLAAFIKERSVAWHVHFIEHDVIDSINIRQAVLQAMHVCIRAVMDQIRETYAGCCDGLVESVYQREYMLLIDGNDFKPFMVFNEAAGSLVEVPHVTIEGGDNLYTAIAAASILAKVGRDDYIIELCEKYPLLISRYGLNTNMGYGTKNHLDGIREHGICQFHRRTYGLCKTAKYSEILAKSADDVADSLANEPVVLDSQLK